jgi:hypothetical protein
LFRHGSDIDHLLFFSKVLFASLKEEFRREGKKRRTLTKYKQNIKHTSKINFGVGELERNIFRILWEDQRRGKKILSPAAALRLRPPSLTIDTGHL